MMEESDLGSDLEVRAEIPMKLRLAILYSDKTEGFILLPGILVLQHGLIQWQESNGWLWSSRSFRARQRLRLEACQQRLERFPMRQDPGYRAVSVSACTKNSSNLETARSSLARSVGTADDIETALYRAQSRFE